MQDACADLVSQFIHEDAGIGEDEAHLLGMALVGMAQVTRPVLAEHQPGHPPGRGRAADRPAGLARHQRLADDGPGR